MSDRWVIDQGDCRDVLCDFADNVHDACVTDPPYELGFMGKAWDRSGIAFQAATWAPVFRVLKPGAYLLAFGGTRTYHRMACAIEDAGFEVRDSLHWMYGTGMPKGKTVLKPGHEPIILARKPLDGTIAANVKQWGVGALNIDACRIAHANAADLATSLAKNPGRDGETVASDVYGTGRPQQSVNTSGRWPANVVLDEGAAAELDAQSGTLHARGNTNPTKRGDNVNTYGVANGAEYRTFAGDSGGASRFFYVAKASTRERNTGCAVGNDHPTVKPIALMRHLVRLVTPAGGIVFDPFCGSGSTGVAALLEGLRFVGIEKSDEYIEIARQRIEHAEREAA